VHDHERVWRRRPEPEITREDVNLIMQSLMRIEAAMAKLRDEDDSDDEAD
jgi:hypothetical protein